MICGLACDAAVQLPAIFGSHMVLQRELPLPIWGRADPGESVTVELATADGKEKQTASTKTGPDGKWRITFKPIRTGPSYVLAVKASNEIQLTNIEAGEVWFCSGQSNMHWTFDKSQQVDNNDKELQAAHYPKIRFFTVKKALADQPQDDAPGEWLVCNPPNLLAGGPNGMSALAD